jgi:hypothetical protein
MRRQAVLKVVMMVVGIIFVAAAYPLSMFFSQEPALAMMLSLYVTLGVFLLFAVRNPAAHRSLIAFTAWSSFAHGDLMAVQASRKLFNTAS